MKTEILELPIFLFNEYFLDFHKIIYDEAD